MKVDARKYRSDIDGLRTIAVLSVVLFHAGIAFIPGGYVGVDVFFVISGYLIGGHIFSEVDSGQFSFASFYVRRCKRILPALFFTLLATYIAAFLLLMPGEMALFSRSAMATVLAVSNIFFYLSINYFSPSSDQLPLLMTWSLGVEEQFYIVFPVLLLALAKWFPRGLIMVLILTCLLSLGWSVHGIHGNVASAFYLLPSRAWELGLGSLLAIVELQKGKLLREGLASELASLLGFGLIGLGIFAYSAATPFPGEYALPPVLGSVLLIMSEKSLLNRRLLGSTPFVAIGKISYSLYLWHWPLLSFARISSDRPLPVLSALLLVLLAAAMAVLSYYVIEQPFRRLKGPNLKVLGSYGIAILLMLLPPVVLAKWSGALQHQDSGIQNLQKTQQAFEAEGCIVGYGISTLDTSPACLPPHPPMKNIALLGDSHANALAPGLRRLASEQNAGFFDLTKSSCPPLLGVTRYMALHPTHADECKTYQTSALQYLRQHPEIGTIVLAGYWNAPFHDRADGYVSRYVVNAPGSDLANDTLLRQGLTAEIRALQAMGRHVILVADVPFMDFDPIRRFAQDHIPLRHALARMIQSDSSIKIKADGMRPLIESIARSEHVSLVDPYTTLCNAEGCHDRKGGDVLYIDPQHLSPAGAILVMRQADFQF